MKNKAIDYFSLSLMVAGGAGEFFLTAKVIIEQKLIMAIIGFVFLGIVLGVIWTVLVFMPKISRRTYRR